MTHPTTVEVSMITRRDFVRGATAVATVATCPAIVRSQDFNSRLQIAGIGCDGKGWSDIKEMSDHKQTQIVGFCGVDLARAEKVRQLEPSAAMHQDHRELLASQGTKLTQSRCRRPITCTYRDGWEIKAIG